MASVLQPWVLELPLMQQTVLICAVRGPDGVLKEHASKRIMRWYRRCVLLAAFGAKIYTDPWEKGGGSFTGELPDGFQFISSLIKDFTNVLDELPFHFVSHLMHASEILGYKHPDSEIRDFWFSFYKKLCVKVHALPEDKESMELRLNDIESDWRKSEE